MGNVISRIDTSEYDRLEAEVAEYLREEAAQEEALGESSSYNTVLMAKKYDDLFLDPLVGFFIPGIGDVISALVIMPALYVALFKLRSMKLFIAVLTPSVLDLVVGAVPVVGDIIDAFYKSNKIAARLIVGYVQRDEETMREINKRAAWGTVILIILALVVYFLFAALISLYQWLVSLW